MNIFKPAEPHSPRDPCFILDNVSNTYKTCTRLLVCWYGQ